jgi:hypothetical protein
VEAVSGAHRSGPLGFIDETWAKTNMTRTHGWHRRGVPLHAKVPHGHWRTMLSFDDSVTGE